MKATTCPKCLGVKTYSAAMCQTCRAALNAKFCACGKRLSKNSTTGQCATCRNVSAKIPPERALDYLYLARRIGSARAAEVILSGAPVPRMRAQNSQRFQPTIQSSQIVAKIACEMEVTTADITGPSRSTACIHARALAIKAMRVRGISYPAIGRRLGGRDHSTIIHAERRFADYAKIDPTMNDILERLTA